MRIRLILVVLLVMFAFSFMSAGYAQSGNSSAVILKLRYQSAGMSGYGGAIKLRNVASGELFESKSKIGMNPFVIIEDIPAGTYRVEELSIISGSNTLFLSDPSRFNLIKIDSAKVNYLGSYMTKKIAPLMGMNFRVTRTDDEDADKIYKQLARRSEKWSALKIDFGQHLFVLDVTTVEIKR